MKYYTVLVNQNVPRPLTGMCSAISRLLSILSNEIILAFTAGVIAQS